MAEQDLIQLYDTLFRPSSAGMARSVQNLLGASSVVEVGCLTSIYLDAFQALGIDAFGTRSSLNGYPLPLLSDSRVLEHDFLSPNPFGYSFDLAMSLEVADKLPASEAAAFVRELCSYADRLLFSAATPGQGGYHTNPQPLSYWVALFSRQSFRLEVRETLELRRAWEAERAPEWLRQNLLVFVRTAQPVSGLDAALELALPVEGFHGPDELAWLFVSAASVPEEEAILEVGSWLGRSSLVLGLGSEAGEGAPVYSIDHHRGDPEVAARARSSLAQVRTYGAYVANLQAARLESQVTPLLGDVLTVRARYEGPPVGLLFLDGERDAEAITTDLMALEPLLSADGLIAVGGLEESSGPVSALGEAQEKGFIRGFLPLGNLAVFTPATLRRGQTETAAARPPGISIPRRDLISIVMPTRNEGQYLKATLDSLLENSRYPHFEVLVMDDASSDGATDFLLMPPYSQDKRLKLVSRRTQVGYLALWQEGVRLSRGSILKILDSHHCFEPYWLANLYDALYERDFMAIMGPVVCTVDPEHWRIHPSAALVGYSFASDLREIRLLSMYDLGVGGRVPWLCGHQMMMSRNLYEAIGGFFPFFEGHGTDDSDLCLRAYLLGYDCYVEPSSVIGHMHKSTHMNRVTFGDVALNQLMTIFLNFGRERFEAFWLAHQESPGFREGIERMQRYRAELERFRDWIARRRRRSPEQLLESLSHY